jgi:hypothetical protein
MKRKIFSMAGGVGWSIFFLLMVSLFYYSPIYAQSPQTNQASDKASDQTSDSPIQLIKPEEGCLNIAKRPVAKCSIKTPFDPQKLLVLFDGTDISGILDITPDGFEYRTALTSGDHTINVTLTTQDGQELKREFVFVRRSKTR